MSVSDYQCKLRWRMMRRQSRNRVRLPAAALTAILFAVAMPSIGNAATAAEYDACASGVGESFVSVAANPTAALVGCEVLADGGTAIDAAIAVQAVLTVVEPQASGFGGGALITYYDSDSEQVSTFDGLSAAGEAVTPTLFTPTDKEVAEHGITEFGDSINFTGRAVGVPGTAAVLDLAHNEFGRKPWGDLFDDAIDLSNNGFPLASYAANSLNTTGTTPMCAYPDIRAVYCDGDTPKPAGATVKNKQLGSLLADIRDGGADEFYDPNGSIAPEIVERTTAGEFNATADADGPAVVPSQLTVDDFASYEARKRASLCERVFDESICTAPAPSTGGTTLINLLRMVDKHDITDYERGSVDSAHLLIEASRIAGVDARAYIGDPEYDGAAPAGLTSREFASQRAGLITMDGALHPVTPGDPTGSKNTPRLSQAGAHDDTSQVAIVDRWGNALSMTTTVNQNFGSRMLARGLVLNNAATNFSWTPDTANAMESGKRARSSIAPTIIFDDDDQVSMVVGSAGGPAIPDFIAQTILGVKLFDDTVDEALAHPHVSGQNIVIDCLGQEDVASTVESGTELETLVPELTERGAPCARTGALRSGGAAIEVLADGTLDAAADHRRDGGSFGG